MKKNEKKLEFIKWLLNSRLEYYKKDINEIKIHINKSEKQYKAPTVIETQTQINIILNYLKNKNIEIEKFDIKEYERELNVLDKKFEGIKQRKDFYEILIKDLERLVKSWEHHVKWPALEGNEFENDLSFRDSCEALLNEVEGKKDVSKLKERLKKADKELQKHAKKLFQRFYEYYESKEWDYYPKEYWWRHLKEFIEEKGVKK